MKIDLGSLAVVSEKLCTVIPAELVLDHGRGVGIQVLKMDTRLMHSGMTDEWIPD